MNRSILFIVPSLEAGAGGVADYVLVLGAELERRGWRVGWMSLREEGLPKPVVRDGNRLRLRNWRERCLPEIRSFVQETTWDWISLQYVGYGFEARGCPWGLGRWLDQGLPTGSGRHVMFHEIWTGAWLGAPWKLKVVGWLQRRCLMGTVSAWAPAVAHTSNATYQALLENGGVPSRILKMFATIYPESSKDRTQVEPMALIHELAKEGGRTVYVMLGTLHPEWRYYPLVQTLVNAGRRSGKSPVIISCGRMGNGKGVFSKMCGEWSHEIRMMDLGERPREELSAILSLADYGIVTTPLQVLGKSTVAAAMLEHGLPVIVTRQERYGLPSDDLAPWDPMIIPMDEHLENRLVTGVPKREAVRGVERVAEEFIKVLETARAGHADFVG